MKSKLLELAEILKQKPEIKDRLEYFSPFGKVSDIPAYHDVLEYLGEDYYLGNGFLCDIYMLDTACNPGFGTHISLSPGPLSDQTDETLDEIISLGKTVGK